MAQTEWIISIDDDLKDIDELFVGNVRDGEQLIRCKDCKYFFHWTELNIMGCKAFDWRSKPDDFCSFAERKEE